jgi:hypothetical protein
MRLRESFVSFVVGFSAIALKKAHHKGHEGTTKERCHFQLPNYQLTQLPNDPMTQFLRSLHPEAAQCPVRAITCFCDYHLLK